MTCIIAHHDGWMVADKKTAYGLSELPTKTQKIMRFGKHTLAGSAGISGASYLLRHSVAGGASEIETPDRVLEMLCNCVRSENDRQKDPEDARIFLMVDINRRIVLVDCMGNPHVLHAPHWAIGCGDDSALGFLAGMVAEPLSKRAGDIAAIDAVHAIRYTSTVNRGVSYDTDTEYL